MGKFTISMVIFNSYFDITRGYLLPTSCLSFGQMVSPSWYTLFLQCFFADLWGCVRKTLILKYHEIPFEIPFEIPVKTLFIFHIFGGVHYRNQVVSMQAETHASTIKFGKKHMATCGFVWKWGAPNSTGQSSFSLILVGIPHFQTQKNMATQYITHHSAAHSSMSR